MGEFMRDKCNGGNPRPCIIIEKRTSKQSISSLGADLAKASSIINT